MSDPRRVLLVGATGLVGTRVMEQCVGREDVRHPDADPRLVFLERQRLHRELVDHVA